MQNDLKLLLKFTGAILVLLWLTALVVILGVALPVYLINLLIHG